jgi:acyl-CoA hydrolase
MLACGICINGFACVEIASFLAMTRFYVCQTFQQQNIMTTDERIKASETRIFKAVFPNTTNHYDTLFGGTAMHMMDEVAFITATRFTRKRMVTVSSDRIDFSRPIPAGTIIELIGTVSHIGNTSLKVQVEIYIEEMYSFEREKAITGTFTFVAIDENKHKISVL